MATSAQLLAAAQAAFVKYAGTVAAILGIDPSSITTPRFVIKKIGGGAVMSTDAAGGTIAIDPSWDPADVGAIVHESVHLLQNLPGGSDPKATEAIADAVRFAILGNKDTAGWTPSALAAKLAELGPAGIASFSAQQQAGVDTATALRTAAAPPAPTTALTPQQLSNMTPAQIAAYNAASGGDNAFYNIDLHGGAGGQSAADAAAAQQQIKNERASFSTQLQLLGLDPNSADLRALIQHATQHGYSVDRFMSYVRQTKEYQQQFPGIFDKKGNLIMDEQTYLSNKQQYESYGSQYGINMGDNRVGWLIQNRVAPDEFADRAPAMTMLRENRDFYKQFAAGLVQSGQATKAEVSDEGIFKFVLGEGNKAWYEELNLANARYAATQSGIKLGQQAAGYSAINPNAIQKIADKGFSPQELQARFEQTAQDLLTTLPEAKIQSYGLSKKDILAARFGGKNQGKVLQLMDHIKKQEDAFYDQRATATIYATAGGVETLGGSGSRPGQ